MKYIFFAGLVALAAVVGWPLLNKAFTLVMPFFTHR